MTCESRLGITLAEFIQSSYSFYGLIVTDEQLARLTQKAVLSGEDVFVDAVIEHLSKDAENPPVTALIYPLIHKRHYAHATEEVH